MRHLARSSCPLIICVVVTFFVLGGCTPPDSERAPDEAMTEATPPPRPDATPIPPPATTPRHADTTPTATPTPATDATTEPPEPTPEPVPAPVPNAFIPYQRIEFARLFNGIRFKTHVTTTEGDLASVERIDPEAYEIEVHIRIRSPRPSTTLEELATVNPMLPEVLPALPTLLETAEVSGYYHQLYENKASFNHSRLHRADLLVSVHNYYDTETILELRHPETGRRALLLQAEMDVVTDGSDGDRWGEIEVDSASFQPFTSYFWPKQTDTPNPFLASWEERLRELEEEFAIPGLSIERNRELRAGIERYRRGVWSLRNHSFLIAEADPFIVVPGMMLRSGNNPDFIPRMGDYAAVIHGDTIYPAIVGDAGPSYKSGEASLRICREIEPRASGIRRAVNDLTVTYLIFPQTVDTPHGPPNLAHWQARVEQYLAELGGHRGQLHIWTDLTAPEPEPELTEPPESSALSEPTTPASPSLHPAGESLPEQGAQIAE